MNFEDIRPAINNSVITLYRIFAVVTLYIVLGAVLIFGLVAGFYAISSTWVAPIILSPADKDTLDLTGKLLNTQNMIDDLTLDIDKLQQTVSEAEAHKLALERLLPAIQVAIARESHEKSETGPPLGNLDEQKRSDITRTEIMLDQMTEVNAAIDKELAAGLISKTDAIEAKMSYTKSNADLTDSKIANVLLKDNILEKTGSTTKVLETLIRKAELESEISTLGITIETAKRQMATEARQVSQLQEALGSAKQTPFWTAMRSGRVNLALVPYENQTEATIGAPVYDCYLSFVACRRVGTVREIFVGEQHASHPIFRTDLRGFLARLELTNPESAKSRTLFLGRKPLFL